MIYEMAWLFSVVKILDWERGKGWVEEEGVGVGVGVGAGIGISSADTISTAFYIPPAVIKNPPFGAPLVCYCQYLVV
jgi:hypothetical protein